jgi:hypothetical protein
MFEHNGGVPILPKVRDPRLITIRRGGSLTDDDHRLLAEWSARCAEHVLHLFEREAPDDPRPRHAIDAGRAWIRGELRMEESRRAAFAANAAARELSDPAKFAALSAGQAAAVPHVAAHDLGAAAYAIRAAAAAAAAAAPAAASAAATSAAAPDHAEHARRLERDWQRDRLPDELRALVLEDQRDRNDICWHAFDD